MKTFGYIVYGVLVLLFSVLMLSTEDVGYGIIAALMFNTLWLAGIFHELNKGENSGQR